MKNIIMATVASSVIALTSGCASILNEDTQRVNITTSNGKVITAQQGMKQFQAPGIVSLTRANKDLIITTNEEGCTKQTLAQKQLEPVFFLNLLSGGSFGSSTDYSTEKMWGYQDTIIITCSN